MNKAEFSFRNMQMENPVCEDKGNEYRQRTGSEKGVPAVIENLSDIPTKKWLLCFAAILYIAWFSLQYVTTISTGGGKSLIPHRIIMNVMSNPVLALVTAAAAAIIAAAVSVLLENRNESAGGYTRSDTDSQGSADFATDQAMQGAVEYITVSQPEGICLGKRTLEKTCETSAVCVTPSLGRNMNFAVFGSTGSGKSYSFARPNILARIASGESFILTDPSGELYKDTAALAEAEGFDVRVLNLKNPGASSGWNPFDSLRASGDMDLQLKTAMLVHTILSNTVDENAKGDVFFDQSEENLLKALILYVAVSPEFAGAEYERHMGKVYDLLTKLSAQEGLLEELSGLPDSDPAAAPWKMFQGAGRLKVNFITGLSSRLEIFQADAVKELFSHSEMDLAAPGRRKCAYYVISSVTNDKMRFLLSLFFSCAFEQLIAEAEESSSGKLTVPVYFILDEFKAIGRINSFADKVANVRKYGISISMIFQDLLQLENAYPRDSQSILSNCDTWLALGVNDMNTARMLSERAGVTTIKDTRVSGTKAAHGTFEPFNPVLKYSDGNVRRNLMNPDEVMRYFDSSSGHGRKVLIFARNKHPYRADAYDWHNHMLAGFVGRPEYTRHPGSYVPPWQKGVHTMDRKRSFIETDPFRKKPSPADSNGYAEKPSGKKGIVFENERNRESREFIALDLSGKR